MLRATLKSNYRSKKSGQKVYVYEIDCTPKEKAALKAAKGEYYRETETGIPMHFITEFDAAGEKRLIEPVVDLLITTNNLVVVDETKTEQALMRDIKQHLGLEIAKAKAASWGKRADNRTATAVPSASPTAKLPSAQELLDESTNDAPPVVVEEGNETIDA